MQGEKSGYRGVCWNKRAGRWQAQITVGRKKVYLGVYDDQAEAGAICAKARAAYQRINKAKGE